MDMKNGGVMAETSNGRGAVGHRLRVMVLGPFRLARQGVETAARTRQVARVGALLAASPGIPVSRERIIDMLWGPKAPATVVNTLQVHVSQLRSMVGKDLVGTVGDGYVLAVDPVMVDAEWFKGEVLDCLDSGRDGAAERTVERLVAALQAWSGEPYAFIDAPEIAARRNELIELRERALETRLDLSLQLASTPRAISEVVAAAKGQVTRQPLREAGYDVLIRALIADGRPVEALEAYNSAVTAFDQRFGVRPSGRLRQAIDAVMGNASEFPLK